MSHQPFLLVSTYPVAEAASNKVNELANPSRPTREPYLLGVTMPSHLLLLAMGSDNAPKHASFRREQETGQSLRYPVESLTDRQLEHCNGNQQPLFFRLGCNKFPVIG